MIFLIAHLDYFYLWPCLAWPVDIMNYGNPVITGLKPAIKNITAWEYFSFVKSAGM